VGVGVCVCVCVCVCVREALFFKFLMFHPVAHKKTLKHVPHGRKKSVLP
jgi:hypothetical protein